MNNLEFNKRVDVTLSIQASRMQVTESSGTHEMDAEVVLLIEDEEQGNEAVSILSTDDIDKMIEQLRTLNEKVKEYNMIFKDR